MSGPTPQIPIRQQYRRRDKSLNKGLTYFFTALAGYVDAFEVWNLEGRDIPLPLSVDERKAYIEGGRHFEKLLSDLLRRLEAD